MSESESRATLVHASTVALGGRGVMLLGPSGAGKSDLALRLIDRGAVLVADDYTRLALESGTLRASAPGSIAGRIEVRGIGIVTMPHTDGVPVALAVQLEREEERLPEARFADVAGVTLPMVAIDPRPASAPIKVELALAAVAR